MILFWNRTIIAHFQVHRAARSPVKTNGGSRRVSAWIPLTGTCPVPPRGPLRKRRRLGPHVGRRGSDHTICVCLSGWLAQPWIVALLEPWERERGQNAAGV